MDVFAVASHRERLESPLYLLLAAFPESTSQFLLETVVRLLCISKSC